MIFFYSFTIEAQNWSVYKNSGLSADYTDLYAENEDGRVINPRDNLYIPDSKNLYRQKDLKKQLVILGSEYLLNEQADFQAYNSEDRLNLFFDN